MASSSEQEVSSAVNYFEFCLLTLVIGSYSSTTGTSDLFTRKPTALDLERLLQERNILLPKSSSDSNLVTIPFDVTNLIKHGI